MDGTLLVLLLSSVSAAAAAAGALPLLGRARPPRAWLGWANALAAGLMLGASFGLLESGAGYGELQVLVGVVLGTVFILATERWLRSRNVEVHEIEGASAQRMILIVVVMTVHSMAEGIAVGASFGGGGALAAAMTIAITVHNVPEGIAISAVLRGQGVGVLRCAWWSVFSSLPQPLLAVPAFLFVETVEPAQPYAIGFAAGAMIFMVLLELLPEAFETAPRARIGLVTSLTLIAMILFQRSL